LRGGQGEHEGRSGRDEKRAIKDILRGVVSRLDAAGVLEVSLRTITGLSNDTSDVIWKGETKPLEIDVGVTTGS
jgi:hypothetical protein